MSDRTASRNFPPTAAEDLAKFGVEPRLIPFVISTILQAEQSPNELPPLDPAEAENLVETLDKVASSTTVNPNLKSRCLGVLRQVSPSHLVLPKSYFPSGVTLSNTIPYSSGGFGRVWKGKLDGNQVCVKVFRIQRAENLDKIKRSFYREVIGWKYFSHPGVLPFLGVSETLFPFCIISPWLLNGNILEYTQKKQGVDRLQLLAQATSGLKYLHSLNIVHTSINPGNILIDDDGVARLGDSGITGAITDPTIVEPHSATTPKRGVVRYMAPELLDPMRFNPPNSKPLKGSDVYSLVMTAYEILTEILPYGNSQDVAIIFSIINGNRPPRPTHAPWLSDQVWNMIVTCWSEKREQRWDISAVCNQLSVSIPHDVEVDPSLAGELPGRSYDMAEIVVQAETQPSQELINSLDKGGGDLPLEDRPKLLDILGKMCRRLATVPDSMHIENCSVNSMDEDYGEYSGGFGTVSRSEYQGRPVAVKVLRLYPTRGLDRCFGEFRREVIAWRHLRHPNILPLIGVNLEPERLAMISEWMGHGNITEFVEKNEGINRVLLLADAVNGLEYMHSIKMVHGDLKGANILIDRNLRACLADFGLSTIVGAEHHAVANTSSVSVASVASIMSFTAGGTIRWMSPELHYPEQFGAVDHRPTKQSDCYALGMVVYEVLCGDVPYCNISNPNAVIYAIMTGGRPQKPEAAEHLGFTMGLWKIIQRCWLPDASERPDVKEVLFQLNDAAWYWDRKRRI